MAFGAAAEMQMYMGEDEGDHDKYEEHSSGGIVVESLVNVRTVASLSIQQRRIDEFKLALQEEDPTPMKTNLAKGSTSGLGQFVQMWGSCVDVLVGWMAFVQPSAPFHL